MEKAKVGMLYTLFSNINYNYDIDEGELEKTVKLVLGLKLAMEYVKKDCPDLSMKVYSPTQHGAACGVELKGEEQQVRHATVVYLRLAGIPYMVTSGSRIVDPLLANYDKETKRKMEDVLVGKWVVDKK